MEFVLDSLSSKTLPGNFSKTHSAEKPETLGPDPSAGWGWVRGSGSGCDLAAGQPGPGRSTERMGGGRCGYVAMGREGIGV